MIVQPTFAQSKSTVIDMIEDGQFDEAIQNKKYSLKW